MDGKPFKSWGQVIPDSAVVGFYGHRRKGKTATAWWLAEQLHKRGKPVAVFMFPPKAKKLLPKWVKHVTTIGQLKQLRGHLVVADELALRAHARDHQSDTNKELYKLMAVGGQCHQLLFLLCQHSRQLDIGLAMEPDLVIFKEPSLLHIRFARPELKPEIQQAWEAFHEIRGDKRKWAYVVDFHEGRTGFLRTKLPSFWSEELSEAYARYEMEQLTGKERETTTMRKYMRGEAK